MWTPVFIVAIILLLFSIFRQLIMISTVIQFLSKDTALLKHKVKEDEAYLFMKG
jgi:hypothetical protein